MILYFSGTGNTKFVAEYLAEALGDELAAMADTIRSGDALRASSEGNIEMKDGKPIFGDKCTWCFSCIQHCPKAAIDIKGRTEGQPRYTCPE